MIDNEMPTFKSPLRSEQISDVEEALCNLSAQDKWRRQSSQLQATCSPFPNDLLES